MGGPVQETRAAASSLLRTGSRDPIGHGRHGSDRPWRSTRSAAGTCRHGFTHQRSALLAHNVDTACSIRFLDPRLRSCHTTGCDVLPIGPQHAGVELKVGTTCASFETPGRAKAARSMRRTRPHAIIPPQAGY
jgi:hypothetical protein